MGEIFKRSYKVRKASQREKEISLPPEAPLKPGDKVTVFYDDFVLYVPSGVKVDEDSLARIIRIPARPEAKSA